MNPPPDHHEPGSSEADAPGAIGSRGRTEMRFQNEYVWFVFFSAMDIMLTWVILWRGGREVNPIADRVIAAWGLTGAILFKFCLALLVIVACEVVARQRVPLARGLAVTAAAVSSLPVFYSLILLLRHVHFAA